MGTITFNTGLNRYRNGWYDDGSASQGAYGNRPAYVGQIKLDIGNFDKTRYKITNLKLTITRHSEVGYYGKEINLFLYAGQIDPASLISNSNNYQFQALEKKTLKKVSDGATEITLTNSDIERFNTYCIAQNSPYLMIYSPEDRGYPGGTTYTQNYTQIISVAAEATYIPLAATGTGENAILGQSNKITFTTLGSGYKYKATWTLGNKSHTSNAFSTTSPISYTIPESWGEEFPNAMSKVGQVTLITYDSNENILGQNSYSITYSCPTTAIPICDFNYANNSQYYNYSGDTVFLQNLSKITLKFENVKSNYGANKFTYTIVAKKDSSILQTWYSSSVPNYSFTETGTITFTGTVKDSRGLSTSKDIKLPVQLGPGFKKNNFSLFRSNSNKQEDAIGTCLGLRGELNVIKDGITFSGVGNGGTFKNLGDFNSGPYYATNVTANTDSAYTVKINITSNDFYSNSSHTTRATYTYSVVLSTANFLMHFKKGGKAIGIGTVGGNDNTISLGWETKFLRSVNFNTSNGALPITSGGTGAITKEGARNSLEITPANIGALSLDGGTLKGTLTVPYLQIYKADNQWPALALGWEKDVFYGSIFASIHNAAPKTRLGFEIRQTDSAKSEYYCFVPNNISSGENLWYRIHSDKTHYPEIRNNEEITFKDEVFMGYITTSGKDVYLTIPIAKSLRRAGLKVDITEMFGRLRCDGNYVIGTANDPANFFIGLVNSSATVKTTTNSVIIYLNYQSALSGSCNNKTCAAAISQMKLRFTNPSYVE